MDSVFIKDLRVQGIIGIHPDERLHPQDIVINITLSADTAAAARTDAIGDCVDYQTIAEAVRARAQTSQRMTVEALAGDLADIVLGMSGVMSVRVRVEKPDALDFCRGVGVEIERRAPIRLSHAVPPQPVNTTEPLLCIGMGSNFHPITNLPAALAELRNQFRIVAVSSVWESAADDGCGPNYLNAAVLIRSTTTPDEVRTVLQTIECKLGRNRDAGRGVIALDLDLLLHGGVAMRAELWNRAYCAVPAAELVPELLHPETEESLGEAARRLASRVSIVRRPEVFGDALRTKPTSTEAHVLPQEDSA